MGGALARRAGAELLIDTLEGGATLDEALDANASYGRLAGADRGFARAMASAALRQLGRVDAGLAPFLDRPLETASPPARALLRIGAAQAWLMETPAHAAVGETVAAAKAWPRASKSAGFVNAVLRKAAHDRAAFDAAPATAVWPDWLAAAFEESLGEDGAQRLAEAQAGPPELHLTAKGDARAVAARAGGEALASGSVRAPPGAVEAMDGYATGDWWVQDAAAALPARILAAQDGELVFDLCAAPGGKTLQLAAAGARVMAVDRSKARLKRLSENLARTGLAGSVDVVASRVEDLAPPDLARKILLDAPCSALGTLQRHPEGAWIKRPGDVARFPQAQARLLRAARDLLAPGGTLVYCVCAPLRAEGVDVVEAAVAEGLYARAPITADEAPGFEDCATPEGDLLTLPGPERRCDAFFIARLRRS